MLLWTMSGRPMTIRTVILCSRVSMTIILRSLPPLAHSLTWKSYRSAFAKPSLTVLTIAFWLAFALIFQTTASHKTTPPRTRGQSSRICSRLPYALKRSISTSGPLPLRLVALVVKLSQPRSTPAKLRRPSPGSVTIMAPASLAVLLKARFVAMAAVDLIHGLSSKTGST